VTLTDQRLSNDFGILELTDFVVQRERDGACQQSPNATAKAFTPLGETVRAEWQQDGCDPFRESALSWAEASDITPSTLVMSASDTADTASAPDMVETIDTYDASERVIYDSVTSAPDIYDSVSVYDSVSEYIFDDVHFVHGMDNVLVPPPTYQEALSPGMRPACEPLALSMPLPMLSEFSLSPPFDYRTESELDHGRLSPTSSVTASVWKYPLEKSIPKPPNPPPSYADILPTISGAQPSSGAPPPRYADLLPSIFGLRERD
jgi:hypothetical protein